MNYDWDKDPKWQAYLKKQGPDTSKSASKDQAQNLEVMKRSYYGEVVEKDFEKNFEFANESERKYYFHYCQLYGNTSSFSYESNKQLAMAHPWLHHMKSAMYFLFLLALPLKIPYMPLIFLVAAFLSTIEKKWANTNDYSWTKILIEEETINIALLIVMLFSGVFIRFFLFVSLTMFAYLVWCDFA